MKTIEELREFMISQMQRAAAGETTASHVNACSNMVGKFLSSIKLEIDYNKMLGTNPDISFLGKSKVKQLDNAVDTKKHK